MRNAVVFCGTAVLALAIFCGCGDARLEMPPSVVSTDEQYVGVENATLEIVEKKEVVRVRLAVFKELPAELLYDVVASQEEGDVIVKKDVPTDIDGTEPGSRKIDIPVEKALRGGKIIFHLAVSPASQESLPAQPTP